MDDKQVAKLTGKWESADTLWKKASKKCQEAIAGYHWTTHEDRANWNKVVVLRMREAIAFGKAEAAHQALADFMRNTPDYLR